MLRLSWLGFVLGCGVDSGLEVKVDWGNLRLSSEGFGFSGFLLGWLLGLRQLDSRAVVLRALGPFVNLIEFEQQAPIEPSNRLDQIVAQPLLLQ